MTPTGVDELVASLHCLSPQDGKIIGTKPLYADGKFGTFDIWEARGACARDCRLDERGLVDADATILGAIAEAIGLLVINRFGRAESLGRGLLGYFTAAIGAEARVLTAVREPNLEAWAGFSWGLTQNLPSEVQAILGWAAQARSVASLRSSAHTHAIVIKVSCKYNYNHR